MPPLIPFHVKTWIKRFLEEVGAFDITHNTPPFLPISPISVPKLKLFTVSYAVDGFASGSGATPGPTGVEILNVSGTGYLIGFWMVTRVDTGTYTAGEIGVTGPEITIDGEYTIPWILEGYGEAKGETQYPAIEAFTHDVWDSPSEPGPPGSNWCRFASWSPATGVGCRMGQMLLPHGFKSSLKIVIKDYANIPRDIQFVALYGLIQESIPEVWRLHVLGHNNCVEASIITAGVETTVVNFDGEGLLWALGGMSNGTDVQARAAGYNVYVDGETTPSIELQFGTRTWADTPCNPFFAGWFGPTFAPPNAQSSVGNDWSACTRYDDTAYAYAGYWVLPTYFKQNLKVNWIHRGTTDLSEAHWAVGWYERTRL